MTNRGPLPPHRTACAATWGTLVLDGVVTTGSATIGGPLHVTDTTASTSPTTGCIVGDGGLGIAGEVYVGQSVHAAGDGAFQGAIRTTDATPSTDSATGALIVTGGAGIGGRVNADGAIKTIDNTASVSTATGAIVAGGGIGAGGAVHAGGAFVTTDATASASPATGSIITPGGIGVAKNSYFGQYIAVAGTVYADSPTPSVDAATGALLTVGGLGVGNNINSLGYIRTNAATPSTSMTTGCILGAGGLGIAGTANIGMPIIELTREAAQTITSGANTGVIWATVLSNRGFTFVPPLAAITIPEDGAYSVDFDVAWDANTTGTREMKILWSASTPAGREYARHTQSATDGNTTMSTSHVFAALSAGQTIEATVRQDSGTDRTISGASNFLRMEMTVAKISAKVV